jgi:hypothetical protein
MIINLGDPLYRPFPNGAGPYSSSINQESWFGISPVNMVGGGTVKAQFALADKRDKTVPVIFKTSNPELLTLPTGAVIPPTANGAQFQIGVKGPQEMTSVTITVIAGSESLSNTLNVYPILADFTLSQTNIKSTGTVTGTVTLFAPANAQGVTVKLNSNQAEIILPEEFKIAAGLRTGTFSITGKPVKAVITAIITASIDNASKSAQLKIAP